MHRRKVHSSGRSRAISAMNEQFVHRSHPRRELL
jgi:hypothetical protein